jgi:hypothetical protein
MGSERLAGRSLSCYQVLLLFFIIVNPEKVAHGGSRA